MNYDKICPKCSKPKNKNARWCKECKTIKALFKICGDCKRIFKITDYRLKKNPKGQYVSAAQCNGCMKKEFSGYYRKNTDKYTLYSRKNKLKAMGLDYDVVEKYRSKHSGKCDICGYTPKEGEKNLAVDHCHTKSKFRGLLCVKCNIGLGCFVDDDKLLLKAIEYLQKSRE